MKANYEHIDSGSGYTQLRISQPTFEFFWHYHPELELTYIQKGSGQRFVGDRIESFNSGDLVLIGPNLPHTWVSSGHKDFPDACQAFVVQFQSGMFDTRLHEFHEFDRIRMLLEHSKRGIRFNGELAEKSGKQLIKLREAEGLHWLTEFWILLDKLAGSADFTYLTDSAYTPSLNKLNPARIDKIFHFLNQHYTEEVSLKKVAELVHLTETSFSRFFKRNIGLTFNEYLNNLRVAAACRLLKEEPEKTIAETAWESGFASSTHFNRMFKSKTGFSPSAYKQKHASPK